MKRRWSLLGLMSGTSADAVDAAWVELEEGERLRAEFRAFCARPLSADLRARVLRAAGEGGGDTAGLCRLHFELGEAFAAAALDLLAQAGLDPARVDLIGSHGQTVRHFPPGGEGAHPPSTLQLGEAAVIAARTGITTVFNFRARDMAEGGTGAPLAPYAHDLLFRREEGPVVFLNIGGMANLTYLPPRGGGPPLAFDTGPGNALLDAAVAFLSGGEVARDEGGSRALRGEPDPQTLSGLLSHPFLRRPPPKATGRETFGEEFARELLGRMASRGLRPEDQLATLAAFTAEGILLNLQLHCPGSPPLREVVAGGGGVHNAAIRRRLERGLASVPFMVSDEKGWPADGMEAAAFALLAHAALRGIPASGPHLTGARKPVVLGSIAPGDNFRKLMASLGEGVPGAGGAPQAACRLGTPGGASRGR
ncbi:MAG: anhydro-N-acetylmuramic acid kinase [Nitrospinota bacterium]